MGGWVQVGAFRDCSWYFGQAHADIGHKAQNVDGLPGGGSDQLAKMSEQRVLRGARELRRVGAVLVRIEPDMFRDLRFAFEPFGIERAWITLQRAFTRDGLNVLQIAERLPDAHDECRDAYKFEGTLEPIMVREWFASVLRNHYKNHTGELPKSHVLAHLVDKAARRVSECLAAYEQAEVSRIMGAA